jgi:SAM-dependent methyltransferase
MSFVRESILKAITLAQDTLRPGGSITSGLDYAEYVRWQVDSSGALFGKFPGFDVRGKTVLEIGCGPGGRAAYMATQGARRVVGIDINAEEVALASTHCFALLPETRGVLEFHVSREDELLPLGEFDLVVLVDTMEHVVSPAKMMRLAHHYTRPGGEFFFSSIGWYHHMGSHTGLIPFVNVFFDDATILNVIRWRVSRPSYVPRRYDSSPAAERWRGVHDLRDRPGEHLNKMTVADMRRLVRHSIFAEGELHIIGFGQRHAWLKVLDPLRHLPWVQECYHSLVVARFRK